MGEKESGCMVEESERGLEERCVRLRSSVLGRRAEEVWVDGES